MEYTANQIDLIQRVKALQESLRYVLAQGRRDATPHRLLIGMAMLGLVTAFPDRSTALSALKSYEA